MEYPIIYPQFYKCTPTKWKQLNDSADALLGYANEGALTYSTPIIDTNGCYYFIVNPEVKELVDLSKCILFEEIELNNIS